MASSPALPARFVALDIRTNAVMIGAVDARRNVALTPRQVTLGALESWCRLHLRPADALVIAAPSCVWELHDQLAPLVASITIAHPQLASRLLALRTAAGARELNDWLRTPPDLVPPPRDELVIKVLVALQVPGTDIHEILQVHRRHVIEIMQRYTQVKAAAGEDDVALALVVDAELFRLEAIVRWLDAADVRLKRMPSSPPAPVADTSPKPAPAAEVPQ